MKGLLKGAVTDSPFFGAFAGEFFGAFFGAFAGELVGAFFGAFAGELVGDRCCGTSEKRGNA